MPRSTEKSRRSRESTLRKDAPSTTVQGAAHNGVNSMAKNEQSILTELVGDYNRALGTRIDIVDDPRSQLGEGEKAELHKRIGADYAILSRLHWALKVREPEVNVAEKGRHQESQTYTEEKAKHHFSKGGMSDAEIERAFTQFKYGSVIDIKAMIYRRQQENAKPSSFNERKAESAKEIKSQVLTRYERKDEDEWG